MQYNTQSLHLRQQCDSLDFLIFDSRQFPDGFDDHLSVVHCLDAVLFLCENQRETVGVKQNVFKDLNETKTYQILHIQQSERATIHFILLPVASQLWDIMSISDA